jgi:hypothetical protein
MEGAVCKVYIVTRVVKTFNAFIYFMDSLCLEMCSVRYCSLIHTFQRCLSEWYFISSS